MNQSQSSATWNLSNSHESTNHTANTMLISMWISCEVTSAILTLFSLYVTIVLVLYMRKQGVRRLARKSRDDFASIPPRSYQTEVRRKTINLSSSNHEDCSLDTRKNRVPYLEQTSIESTKSNSNLIHSTSIELQEYPTNVVSVQRRSEKDRGAWLMRAIVTCTIVVTLRCVVEQCLMFMGDLPDPICDYLTKAMIASTALSLHCCHVFLWLRQLTFYSNPFLKPLRSRKLKALSYAAYAIMPITLTAVLALFMVWRDYESIGGVCVPSTVNLSTYLPFGFLVASTVTIQILLSSLFLYPLLMHRKKRKVYDVKKPRKDSAASTCSASVSSTRKAKRDKLMDCIKRVFYGATVGITTDVVGGIFSIFIPNDIPMFAYSILYNLNIWLNMGCLIYTYAHWRQMVFPWCCGPKVKNGFKDAKSFRRSSTRSERMRQSSIRRYNNRPARPVSVHF